jgi:hypothetical protein
MDERGLGTRTTLNLKKMICHTSAVAHLNYSQSESTHDILVKLFTLKFV